MEDAANIVGFSRATGYNLQKLWNEGGLNALRPKSGPGRSPRMTTVQRDHMKNIVAKTPMETKSVRLLMKKEFNIDYSIKQVHTILINMGFRHEFLNEKLKQGRFKKKILWFGYHEKLIKN